MIVVVASYIACGEILFRCAWRPWQALALIVFHQYSNDNRGESLLEVNGLLFL
jgi:hypothetical protein